LSRAAELGFASVPPLYVDRMLRILLRAEGKGVKPPSMVIERTIHLIKLAWPKITKSEMHTALLAMVNAKKQSRRSTIEVGSELYDTVFESSDKAELKSFGNVATGQRDAHDRVIEALKSGSKFLTKLGYTLPPLPDSKHRGAPDAIKPKAVVDWAKYGLDREKLKKLCPPGHGVRIQLDPAKRSIQAFYPGVLPASRSRTWGALMPRHKVLRHVFTWLWKSHEQVHPGKKCPYNFGAKG